MKNRLLKRVLKWLNRYLTFFLLVAFAITCCTMLFVSVLTSALGIELNHDNIRAAAQLTFGNVMLLSLLFTVIDTVRRKRTVERPVKDILKAAEKIVQGDFSVRIPPVRSVGTDSAFSQIAECFNTMAEELGSVETLRTDFVANVSHEMKIPLAVMQNYGKLLMSPDLPEDKRLEYAAGVTDNARRMADMMDNILRLNRLENQQIFPQVTEFDLGEQLCECLLQFEAVWEKADIEIQTDITDGVTVRADAELLSHVWNNLFSNAFKFTPPCGKVSVSLEATPHHAVVKVSDTGCGMDSAVGAHIFEKFYQGDSSRAASGNGLGLALVKRVIDILHGEITVESVCGQGSTFTVTLRRGVTSS